MYTYVTDAVGNLNSAVYIHILVRQGMFELIKVYRDGVIHLIDIQ